jgi:DNA-directed RNA polymerase subunit RPC12/RpoP
MAEGKLIPHPLVCDACGRKFEDKVWHSPVNTADRGVLDWAPHQPSGDDGIECPSCGSRLIRLDL